MTNKKTATKPDPANSPGDAAPPPPAIFSPIDTVADFLVEGQAAIHIIQYLEGEQITAEAAMNILHEALNKFVKIAKLPKEVRRGWLIECARDLFRQMKSTGDYSGALKALDFISKLTSAIPSKNAPPPTTDEIADDIDDYIKDMMEL